jgi:hypothetical protein
MMRPHHKTSAELRKDVVAAAAVSAVVMLGTFIVELVR